MSVTDRRPPIAPDHEGEPFVTVARLAEDYARGERRVTLSEVMRAAKHVDVAALCTYIRDHADYALKEAAHFSARGHTREADERFAEARRFEFLEYHFAKAAIRRDNAHRTAVALSGAAESISTSTPVQLTRLEAEALLNEVYGRQRGTALLADLNHLRPGNVRSSNVRGIFDLTLRKNSDHTTAFFVTAHRGGVNELREIFRAAAARITSADHSRPEDAHTQPAKRIAARSGFER